MSQSFHLFQLQKIDTQLDQGNSRLLEINRKIENDSRIHEQQELVDQSKNELAKQRSQLKRIEDEAASKRVKLEQSEAALYGGKVKVPKELQDLQKEVSSLKKAIEAIEDQQLEAMMKVEDAIVNGSVVEKTLIQIQALVQGENAVLVGESSMLKTLAERLQVERNAVVNQIDNENREDYERLRKTRRGIAVASLAEDSCTGCGTMLTPADRQSARSPSQLFHCPSCGRFIYAG